MPQRITAFLLVLVPMLAILGCENDLLEPDLRGSIEGQVIDAETNAALGGAGITTNPPSSSLLTDGEGRFRLENLPEGNYTVTARRNGYRSNTTTVSVRDGETTPAVIFLEESDADDDTTATADFQASVLGFSNRFRGDSVYVAVEYRARNTGDTDIELYEIYFQLLTTGQTYFHEVSGDDLRVGQSDIGEFEKYVGRDTVTVVQISDIYYSGQN